MGQLTRLARIARPGALYDASVSAHTSAATDETIVGPIDFDEVADVNIARAIVAESYSHMPGFNDINRVLKRTRIALICSSKIKGRHV